MPQELVVAPVGLFTDPNPLSAAPPGSMSEALNVVIARPGVIEPRPGFQADATFTAHLVDEDIVRIIPFESDLLVLTKDASDGTGHAYWFSANDDITQTGDLANGAAWGLTVGRVHGVSTKGNLYITCTEGVFRAIDPGDDTAARAGLIRPGQCLITTSTTGFSAYPLEADEAAAYRLCRSTTAGTLEIRSAPSGRILARSYTGSSPKTATLTFADTAAESTELYRSNAFTSTYTSEPTDELNLVGSAAASATSYSDDSEPGTLLGPSLYTNATQQGALLENGITPICRDVSMFREMVFFGGATWPHSLTFDVIGVGQEWRSSSSIIPYASSLWSTALGVQTTAGSPTATVIVGTEPAPYTAGMRIFAFGSTPDVGDGTYPIGTYVTNASGVTLTLSNNATATNASLNSYFDDWVEISLVDGDGTTTHRVFLHTSTTAGANPWVNYQEFYGTTTTNVAGAQDLAYKFTDLFNGKLTVSAFGDGVNTPWTFMIESWRYDTTALTVKCSRPGAVLPRIDSSTGKAGQKRGGVAALAWSKPGEPEHVPPGYNTEIGASDKAIERIVAAADALYVFKEDGVWRVTGYSPDTLQVDEFDRTMRLVHPDAACEWDGRVAAWTNKGVMLIGGGGAQEISLPIANVIQDATDVHAGNAAQGVFMTGWLDRGLLLLGIPSTTATGYAEYIYCWSQRTGAWTRWNHSKPITTAAAVGDTLYFGTKAPSAAGKASVLVSTDDSYDVATSVTVASVTGTSVTINSGSGWTPAVGDIVNKGGADYAVTAIASATAFTVHTSGLTTGAATAYERSDVELEWTVRDGENPGAQKLFREATFLFGSAVGVTDISSSYVTDRSRTAATSTATLDYTTSAVPETVRTRIPREAKRCGRMEHAVTIPGAKPAWTLHGASYVYEPLNTRFPNAG